MARTKQTSRKTSGRKGVAKKKALAIMAPATKSRTGKRKGYVSSFQIQEGYTLASRISDAEENRSGQPEFEDANAEAGPSSNSSSSTVVNPVRAVRVSYDQAPKYQESPQPSMDLH
jgi:hypothetical protein